MPNGKTISDDLLELLANAIQGKGMNTSSKPKKNYYLSEAQKRFFTQRRPMQRETLTLMQRMPTPQETRQRQEQMQQQMQQPRGDVRQMLRDALLKEQTEIAKENRQEERKIAEEQRKAARREREDRRKRIEDLQDKLATAQTDRERVEYNKELDALQSQDFSMSAEDRAAAEAVRGIDIQSRLAEIDAHLQELDKQQYERNIALNDPNASDDEITDMLRRANALDSERRNLMRERRRLIEHQQMIPKLEELERREEMEKRAAEQQQLEDMQRQREMEEMRKRPVETREEEATRELEEKEAEAEATTAARERAKEPFQKAKEQRANERKTAQDEKKFIRDKQIAAYRAKIAGDKSEEHTLRNYIYREYQKKPDNWYEWKEKVAGLDQEARLYRRAMVKAEEEGRPEDADKMREKAEKAEAAKLTQARNEPKREEDFSTFYEKRLKELKKQTENAPAKKTVAGETDVDLLKKALREGTPEQKAFAERKLRELGEM